MQWSWAERGVPAHNRKKPARVVIEECRVDSVEARRDNAKPDDRC